MWTLEKLKSLTANPALGRAIEKMEKCPSSFYLSNFPYRSDVDVGLGIIAVEIEEDTQWLIRIISNLFTDKKDYKQRAKILNRLHQIALGRVGSIMRQLSIEEALELESNGCLTIYKVFTPEWKDEDIENGLASKKLEELESKTNAKWINEIFIEKSPTETKWKCIFRPN